MTRIKSIGLEEKVQAVTLLGASAVTWIMHYVNTVKGVITPVGVYMNPVIALLLMVCALTIAFSERWASYARNIAYYSVSMFVLVIYALSMHVYHNKYIVLSMGNFMPVGLYFMAYLLVPEKATRVCLSSFLAVLAITLPEFRHLSEDIQYFTISLMLSQPIFISGAHFAAKLKSEHVKMRVAERELRSQINKDVLTQLANRNPVYAEFAQDANTIRTSRGAPDDVTVYMLDIDHFKRINDTLGHSVGDRMLMEVAHALQSSTRPSDLVARWGGEEFVVIARNVGTYEVAEELGQRMQAAINKIHPGGGLPCLSVSMGIATRSGYEKLADLLEYADKKAYEAKRAGRNRQIHWCSSEELIKSGGGVFHI